MSLQRAVKKETPNSEEPIPAAALGYAAPRDSPWQSVGQSQLSQAGMNKS